MGDACGAPGVKSAPCSVGVEIWACILEAEALEDVVNVGLFRRLSERFPSMPLSVLQIIDALINDAN